jgi:hypothetical protein
MWLTSADDGEVDLNAPGVACGLVAAVWQSDAPCALDDQGVCQLVLDASYWDMLGHLPTAVPTETPLPRSIPTLAPRSTTQRAPAPAALAPSQPRIEAVVIVQTVLVTPEASDMPTARPVATETPKPLATPTATLTPATAMPVALPMPELSPTIQPQVIDRARALVPSGASHAGWFLLALGVVTFAAAVAWFTRGRRRYVL